MKRMMLLAIAVAPLLDSALADSAIRKGDPSKGKQLAQQTCAACHGIDGNSTASMYPSLAGQPQAYLYHQLKAFKLGTRKDPQMMGMVAPLSDTDMLNAAAYFNSQVPAPRDAIDKTQLELGKKIYLAGNPVTHVPACMGCHGPSGAGIPEQFPRLGGQPAAYIAKQLADFKAGKQRSNPTMYDIANRLSDTEIKAVADYISGLR